MFRRLQLPVGIGVYVLKRIIGKWLRQVKGTSPSDTEFALEESGDPEIL